MDLKSNKSTILFQFMKIKNIFSFLFFSLLNQYLNSLLKISCEHLVVASGTVPNHIREEDETVDRVKDKRINQKVRERD